MALNLNREVVLLAGGPGSGKSYSVALLIKALESAGTPAVIIDHDRGLAKALKEVGQGSLSTTEYVLAVDWPDVERGVELALTQLPAGGWLVFEMIGRLWDLVQTHYSERVYGEDPTRHLLDLRADAEARIMGNTAKREPGKERLAATAYGGFEGRTDWGLIKRLHNVLVFDRVLLRGEFNMLSTTSLAPIDSDMAALPRPFTNLRMKPEGEKHQVYRHDTIAVLTQDRGRFMWQTDLVGMGKDRGRPLIKPTDCTGVGFVESYRTVHKLQEEK